MRRLVTTTLLLFAFSAQAQLKEGDRQWARRAEGSQAGRAKAEPVDAAIAGYRKALTQSADLEAHWKLLRALRFKGAYVASSPNEKKLIYTQAKDAGDRALAVVRKLVAARKIDPDKAKEKQVADVIRTIPGAAEIYLWDAVNWGEWALAYGKMAAARQGAADRIRREATIARLADPKLEGGTPARVLGRLHDQTPRVPFITGWASGREAVQFLKESQKIDPANKITMVFLAEAMVSYDSKSSAQAIQLLRTAISVPNEPEFFVEQSAAQAEAREVLKKWGV